MWLSAEMKLYIFINTQWMLAYNIVKKNNNYDNNIKIVPHREVIFVDTLQ